MTSGNLAVYGLVIAPMYYYSLGIYTPEKSYWPLGIHIGIHTNPWEFISAPGHL